MAKITQVPSPGLVDPMFKNGPQIFVPVSKPSTESSPTGTDGTTKSPPSQPPPETIAAYEATDYRVETSDGVVTVRIGERVPERLWRGINGVRPERWAIVTAFNPFSRLQTDEENQRHHEDLERRVAAAGYLWLHATGADPRGEWPAEKSVAILNPSNEELDDLMRAFGQNAVVVAERDRAACLRFHPLEASRQSPLRETMKTLYFTEANGSLVFATPEIAERVSQIHFALSAPTWGELKARMPEGELESLRSEDEDPDDPPTELDDATKDPADYIPGFNDGDYPIWLQTCQDNFLPADIRRQFGVVESTWLNGNFWRFDPAHADAIVEALRSKGYEVIRRDDLTFW